MSNTSNFDYCVQFGIEAIREIFHLALKNEDIFPHNLPPILRDFGGHAATVQVRLLDDADDPADLSFQDEKHILFDLPIEIQIETPDAPDPELSQVTLKSTVQAPGRVASWPVDGEDQLGVEFSGISASDVQVPALTGLPALDAGRFEAALHTAYVNLPTRVFALGPNVLTIYDGTRDPALLPPNAPGDPEISATLETHDGTQYLRVSLPLHASVPSAFGFDAYGTATFWREVQQGEGTVRVLIGTEPDEETLATQIDFDTSSLAEGAVVAQLTPLLVGRLGDFGTIEEPWFDQAAAVSLLQAETAAYLQPLRFPMYTPSSGDDTVTLATPVGFLLVATETFAILMNRRTGTEADDTIPDDFRDSEDLALALSRTVLDETIAQAIADEFPGLSDSGERIETDEGDATLQSLSVTPSDPGTHDESEGHLWINGEAEVHIDCWPDPDISFDGPIFLRLETVETDTECSATFKAEMGDFDAGQSCCDVFVDLIIPIVGWIMLGVIENMIDKVGGELAEDFADAQERQMQPIPNFVVGVAELQACLEACLTSSQGLVLPGKLRIRREGLSFEDLEAGGRLPRP
ncbi:hypothetical protein [uncultured Roseobacter sp.]|uniref:hypothetical protein n=1 Tax=uncultured Roseobacter sp. TaxID=114847 RepID=UPI002621D5E1|nr:hypothetical protein [uncultured Roseobacter sp.]